MTTEMRLPAGFEAKLLWGRNAFVRSEPAGGYTAIINAVPGNEFNCRQRNGFPAEEFKDFNEVFLIRYGKKRRSVSPWLQTKDPKTGKLKTFADNETPLVFAIRCEDLAAALKMLETLGG